MVKAFRNWLETHELPAIIVAIFCVLTLISTILVVGGYLIVTP